MPPKAMNTMAYCDSSSALGTGARKKLVPTTSATPIATIATRKIPDITEPKAFNRLIARSAAARPGGNSCRRASVSETVIELPPPGKSTARLRLSALLLGEQRLQLVGIGAGLLALASLLHAVDPDLDHVGGRRVELVLLGELDDLCAAVGHHL